MLSYSIKLITTIVTFISIFLIFPIKINAHDEGNPAYIKVGGEYSLHNADAYDPKAKIITAGDVAAEVFTTKQEVNFELDYKAAGIPEEAKDTVVVKWTILNGKNLDQNKIENIGNPYKHIFEKEGSYLLRLSLGKKDSPNTEPIVLDSVLIHVSDSSVEDNRIEITAQKSDDNKSYILKDNSKIKLNDRMWAIGTSKILDSTELKIKKEDLPSDNTFIIYRTLDEHNILRDYMLQATKDGDNIKFTSVYITVLTVTTLSVDEKKETSPSLLLPVIIFIAIIVVLVLIFTKKKNGRKSHK